MFDFLPSTAKYRHLENRDVKILFPLKMFSDAISQDMWVDFCFQQHGDRRGFGVEIHVLELIVSCGKM